MNEKTWLSATTNPQAMYDHVDKRASDRKVRLFRIACARRVEHLLTPERLDRLFEIAKGCSSWDFSRATVPTHDSCREAIALAESAVDGRVAKEKLRAAEQAAYAFSFPAGDYAATYGEDQGPYEYDVLATGSAAEAVSHTCGDRPGGWNAGPLHAARAIAAARGDRDDDGDPAELAEQCRLIREVFGNPYRPVAFDPGWRTAAAKKLAKVMYDAGSFDRMPELGEELARGGCKNKQVLDHCREPAGHVRGCWVVDMVLQKG